MTSLKTVSMYLRAAKTEAEDAGESTDGMAESVSELRSEILSLTGNKVDIQIDSDNFKSTYQIIKELSEVWDELSDVSQANILELIGGKRNSNVISAMLNNFSIAEEALKTSAEAAGSAVAENEKYLDSIEGKVAQFKASFEELSNSLVSSSVVKGVVEFGTGLLNVITALQKIHVLLPSIVASLAIIKGYQVSREVAASAQKVQYLSAMLISQKNMTESLAASVSKLNAAELQELKTKLKAAVASGTLTAAEYAALGIEEAIKVATVGLSTANKGLATSIKAVVSSIPVLGWVSIGISVITEVVSALTTNINTTTTSLEEINETVQTTVSNFSSLKSSADETIPRFVELAAGVNNLGENVSLTEDEYEEFWELNNKLAEMFPELDLGLDSNGNHILALSYSVDSLTESLEALVEAERKAANESVASNMEEALKTAKKTNKEYASDEKNLQNVLDTYEEIKNQLTNDQNSLFPAWASEVFEEAFGADVWGELVDKFTNESSGQINWKALFNSQEFADQITYVERQMDALKKKQSSVWSQLNPIMGAWLQTTDSYTSASDDVQTLLSKIIGNVDYEAIGITNADKLKEYIQANFIDPIADAKPEVQDMMLSLFDLQADFSAGNINVGEYDTVTNDILNLLKNAGISDEIIVNIKTMLDVDGVDEKIAYLKQQLKDEVPRATNEGAEKIEDYIDGLSGTELTIAYEIIKSEGSMSLDELIEKIRKARYAASGTVNPLDFTDFVSGLDEAANGLDKITSAMQTLADGTALSKKELMELVSEYPQLLEQANLFSDGSVEAQENALNSILDLKEQEYDAEIDTKIAELEATVQVLNDQLDLETQKANVITDLENMVVNGKVDQEEQFVGKVNELNDLQGQNYVSMQNGELQVNEEALNDQLAQGTDYGEQATTNIWEPVGQVIADSHATGLTKALTAVGQYLSNLYTKVKNAFSSLGTAVSNAFKDLFSGNWQGISAYFKGIFSGGGNTVSAGSVNIEFGGSKTTIDGQDVDDWVSDQKKASTSRINAINELKTKTLNSINNLKALKGLKLSDLYATKSSGSGGSGSGGSDSDSDSGSDTSDEESWFETLYNYHKHLVEMEQETTSDFLKWLDDAYKAAYKEGLLDLDDYYKYEEEVFDGLNDIREEAKDTIDELVDYRVDMLKQDIENQKDALDKELDDITDFYDKQRDLLESQNEEDEYLKDQAEKRKSVTDIQEELRQLERDNSAWAQKRKAELNDELVTAQNELDEFEKDHALDVTLDYIDKEKEAKEEEIQAQIDALEEKLNDPGLLVNQALEAIKQNTGSLYQQMLEYNRKYGTGKDEDVKETYEAAYKASEAYKDSFGALYEGIALANSTGYKKPSTGSSSSGTTSGQSTTSKTENTTSTKTSSNAAKSSAPSLKNGSSVVVKKTATNFGSKSQNARMASFVKGGTYTVYGTSGDQVLIGQGGVYTGWIKKTDIEGYAGGTSSATRGLHAFDEEGTETIFESADGNRYKMFTGGEKVLNARASNFLYSFANNGEKILEKLVDVCQNGIRTDAINPSIVQSEVVMGDIIIQGNADTQTVSQIRREQRSAVETILKEFNKLSK